MLAEPRRLSAITIAISEQVLVTPRHNVLRYLLQLVIAMTAQETEVLRPMERAPCRITTTRYLKWIGRSERSPDYLVCIG